MKTEPKPKTAKVSLRRIRLNSCGYDRSGYYWGLGLPLYYAVYDGFDEDWQTPHRSGHHFRARNRNDAKDQVRQWLPGARFYN